VAYLLEAHVFGHAKVGQLDYQTGANQAIARGQISMYYVHGCNMGNP